MVLIRRPAPERHVTRGPYNADARSNWRTRPSRGSEGTVCSPSIPFRSRSTNSRSSPIPIPRPLTLVNPVNSGSHPIQRLLGLLILKTTKQITSSAPYYSVAPNCLTQLMSVPT
ncbi:hypothetical protein ACHWQZ_G018902 [Mnemiopsis leidyi]